MPLSMIPLVSQPWFLFEGDSQRVSQKVVLQLIVSQTLLSPSIPRASAGKTWPHELLAG